MVRLQDKTHENVDPERDGVMMEGSWKKLDTRDRQKWKNIEEVYIQGGPRIMFHSGL